MSFLTKFLRPVKPPALLCIDVDDVLWPLDETACRMAGVEYERIVTFDTRKNPLLTEDEKQRMLAAYSSPALHEKMPMYPGVRALGKIAADPRIRAAICSNSILQEAIDNKERNLSSFFGEDWQNFETIFHLIDLDGVAGKKWPDNPWCVMDDSPHNALSCGARHILVPMRPWNTSEYGVEIMRPVLDRVRYYSCMAEACEILTMLMDKDLGPRME